MVPFGWDNVGIGMATVYTTLAVVNSGDVGCMIKVPTSGTIL